MLAAQSLVWGEPNPQGPNQTTDDFRLRLIECMTDFQLAQISLSGSLPAELEQEMAEICNELDKWRPKRHGHPATSGLFNGGRGKKGRHVARWLAERILAVYVDIHRFDAVATHS